MPTLSTQLSWKPLDLLIERRLRKWKREREEEVFDILKGLEVPSGREFVEVFEDACKYVLDPDKVLQLSDIVCINRDKKFYRAKIENVEIFNQ